MHAAASPSKLSVSHRFGIALLIVVAACGLAVAAYFGWRFVTGPPRAPLVTISPHGIFAIVHSVEDRPPQEFEIETKITNRAFRSIRFNNFYNGWSAVFRRPDGTILRGMGFVNTVYRGPNLGNYPLLAPGESVTGTILCQTSRHGSRIWWHAFDRSSGQMGAILQPGRYQFRIEYHGHTRGSGHEKELIALGIDPATLWSGTVHSNWIDLHIIEAPAAQ